MAILPRYQRMQRRDWKSPFSWFDWRQMVVASATAHPLRNTHIRISEDGTARLAEDGTARLTEGT